MVFTTPHRSCAAVVRLGGKPAGGQVIQHPRGHKENTMHHDYPTSKKSLPFGACAIAAAVLFGSGFLPASASAADYRHGQLNGRHVYGCKDLPHYRDVYQAFKKSKKDGQAELDRRIAAGDCKMLQNHAKAEVKGSRIDFEALHLKVEGESDEFWIEGEHFKHN